MDANETNARLGEMLVRAGKLKSEQVQEALKKLVDEKRGSLLTALMDLGHLPFSTVAQFVEKILSMKTYAIGGKVIDANTLSLVSQKTIEQGFIFPIGLKKNKNGQEVLIVGIVDPLAQNVVDDLEKEVGKKVFPVLISKPDFVDAFQRHFKKATPPSSSIDAHTVSVTVDSSKLPPIPGVGDTRKIEIQTLEPLPTQVFKQKFPAANQESTKNSIELTQNSSPLEIETSSSMAAASTKTGTFDFGHQETHLSTGTVGESTKRFKEEALAKLDLNPSEARLLEKETYTRELLIQDLAQISLKSLQNSVEDLSIEQRLEAVTNLLLSKRLVTSREIYTQYAVSKVFSSREKSKKDNP